MTESSTDQRRGSQLDDQSSTCPTWCKGGHAPVDDFHMSEPTGEWLAEVRFARSDADLPVTAAAALAEDSR